MDWADYDLFAPGVSAPLRKLPRREARAAYQRLMDSKVHRLDSLAKLLAANGVDLASDDASIQRINDWFRASVEESPERPGELLPKWYSVVNDLQLFLGEVMIERNPQSHWGFVSRRPSDLNYQNAVITGVSTTPGDVGTINIDYLLAQYGRRVVAGEEDPPDEMLRWIKGARDRIDLTEEIAGRERS